MPCPPPKELKVAGSSDVKPGARKRFSFSEMAAEIACMAMSLA